MSSKDEIHVVSSAKIKGKADDKQLGRSLIYNANKSGPKILPCGTPNVTLTECENAHCLCGHIEPGYLNMP